MPIPKSTVSLKPSKKPFTGVAISIDETIEKESEKNIK
jgi:hypothetical protein